MNLLPIAQPLVEKLGLGFTREPSFILSLGPGAATSRLRNPPSWPRAQRPLLPPHLHSDNCLVWGPTLTPGAADLTPLACHVPLQPHSPRLAGPAPAIKGGSQLLGKRPSASTERQDGHVWALVGPAVTCALSSVITVAS